MQLIRQDNILYVQDTREREFGMDTEQARIENKLQKTSYPELWRITCSLNESGVVISGVVRTYYLKQLAQILVQSEVSVPIRNDIQVRQ